MSWDWHLARLGMRNDYRILVVKPEGRRYVGRTRRGYGIIKIKLILNNVLGYHAVDSPRLG